MTGPPIHLERCTLSSFPFDGETGTAMTMGKVCWGARLIAFGLGQRPVLVHLCAFGREILDSYLGSFTLSPSAQCFPISH